MEQFEITKQIEPIRFAQFPTLEDYNVINRAIAAWKDEQTQGEYSRTHTEYEYTPEPEQVDGYYYMEVKPELAHLFEGVTVLDAIPKPQPPDSTWLKADIQNWLTQNSIEWNSSMTKTQLLSLLP